MWTIRWMKAYQLPMSKWIQITHRRLKQFQHLQLQETLKEFSEAQFILYLRAKNIPETVISKVIENIEILVRSCIEEFHEYIDDALSNKGIMLQEYVNILPIIENCRKVFSNLKTKYKQDVYFKTHMSLIEPKRYRLRERIIRSGQPRIGENRDLKVEEDEIIYISIVELVKKLLSNEEYKKLIEPDTSIKKDVLRSFEDGSFAKENKLVQECGKNCILFMVYFDEANLTDTSSERPTKMVMFYIIIINIHPGHRSQLKCINLCLTVETDLMNAYEMDDILTPILNDIKTF